MTDQQILEMSDEEFETCEKDFFNMIGEDSVEPDASSEARIESILKRAKFESLGKDSADFVVESFGRGLLGITDALIGITEKGPKPRKRSF